MIGSISPVNEPIETILETPGLLTRLVVEYGPRVLSALLVLLAGYFVMRWIAGFAERGLSRFPLEQPARDLILRAVKLLVFALFVVMALQNLGIDLLPLLAGLGIAGAGIALALQGVLGNVAAGLTIIFTRPFHVGEYVSIVGEEGRVQEISLFSTTLRHADLSQVVIPNRKIVGEILHNYGVIRQLDMSVGVAYATDLDAAIAVVREVLAANPRVLQEPAPVVQVSLLGKFAINIAVKPWVAVKDFAPAAGEIYPEIVRAFRERGIEIPIPMLKTMTEQVS
jgi:small conductance mechanosensitive channel